MRGKDFSLQNLYAALDEQRQVRGLIWAQVAREINGPPQRISGHALSASTITGTRIRSVAEGDGILQMLRWLNRTAESFVPDPPVFEAEVAQFPVILPGQVLRFDTKRIYTALDAQRVERQLTWTQLGRELGLSATSLTHLSKGGRTSFPSVTRITRWLNLPAAHFTRGVGAIHSFASEKPSPENI